MTELTGKELRQMHLARLGKILSNLSIVALLISLGGLLGYVFIFFYYIILIMGIIVTLGLILLATDGIDGLFDTAKVATDWFNNVFSKTSLYMAPIALAIATAAIVLLVKDKKENHNGRICVSVAVILISVTVLIVKIVQVA